MLTLRYNLEFRKITFFGLIRYQSIRKSKQISGQKILSMNETLVSLYYQGYRLLYFTLFQFFFGNFIQLNGFVLLFRRSDHFKWREQEEWCRGSSLLCSSFILSSCCVKIEKKRVHTRLRRELNVYEYFVTATFSTWMQFTWNNL